MKHTIDATGKTIGRVASEAAMILIGKNKTNFAKNVISGEKVEVINCNKAKILAKKKKDFIYATYTGHRGGLVRESLGHLIERKGTKEVFRRAILGMIPKNKLYKKIILNLTVTE